MSDNEIEDVSFLPGENLHRRALYEPNIIQKLRNVACNKGRAAVIATIACLFLLVIALIAALSSGKSCNKTVSGPEDSEQPGPLNQDYISTNGKPFPYKEIRLPDTVIPTSYLLQLHPNISLSVFTGHVKINCDIKKPTDFIVFHIKNLTITKLEVHELKSSNKIPVLERLEYITNEQVYVKLETRLVAGSKVMLDVEYQGDLVKKLAGFYKSTYKTKSGEERSIATTHFEPTDARAAFPCFDEPHLKAKFKLSMIRELYQISLFNMPLLNTVDYDNGLKKDIFDESVIMSTYLVAFVVCDYENVTKSTNRGKVTVRVFAPEDSIHAATFALETAVKVIDYYEEYFKVDYPLPKLDLIAIPDFAAGAMENWGLITYRETAVLYDPKVSSARNKERVAVIVAHELAHQWFGNLVTMAWWDDLWLNEGFASFVEYIGSGIDNDDWKMDDQFVTETLLNAMYLDSLENSHPINLKVDNPNQINELFDTITYDKGASIIRMLNNFLTEEVFKKGLTAYLNKYKYSNAATDDLWDSLSLAVTESKSKISTDVKRLMRTWTEQMGYPVITLSRQKGRARVNIQQDRFLLYKQPNMTSQFSSPFGYRWEVPFTYSDASNSTKVNKYLLKDATGSFEVAAGINWVKGNYKMTGYYRVNYDPDNWKALIRQLNTNNTVFHTTERAGMIDDAFALSRAGLLHYNTSLDLSLYMVNEDDYIPWQTLIDNWKFLEHRLENKPIYTKFKNIQLKLIKKQLSKITWEDTGTMLDKYLRSAILNLAISLKHNTSVQKGKELFTLWKTDHDSINVNLKTVIYKTGIMYGTEEDWNHVWNAYLNEPDASEKIKLLSALGHSKESRILSRFMNYSLNDTLVRSQDAFRVLISVSGTYTGQILAWRFFQQNWKIYQERYAATSFIMSSLIKSICSKFATQFDHDEVQAFFSQRDVGSGKRAVSQVLEKIQSNIEWSNKFENAVTTWLTSHGN